MRTARPALALCLLLSLLPAQAAADDGPPFDGFYMGLGGGAALMNVEAERVAASGERSGWTGQGQSWQAAGFFGSMARLGAVLLGVEIELAAQPLRVDLGEDGQLASDGFLGLRALIGVTPRPATLVYLAPGVRFSLFRYEHEGFAAAGSDSRLAHGLSLGAGLEQALALGLLLRLEISATRWSDLEVEYAGEGFDGSRLTLEPTSYGTSLALAYEF